MISCIVLSAGLSSRFGSPKALASLNGQTVIEHLLHNLVLSCLDEIIIVLGAEAERIEPYILKHKKAKVVYNKDYNFGQTSSFQVGLQSLDKNVNGFMLLPVDYPLVRSETIDFLISKFLKDSEKITIPVFENKKGHPPIFPVSLKNEFLLLSADKGLNAVAHRYPEKIKLEEVLDFGVTQTFNTSEEFKNLTSS
ncbi:MAG: nucleotidyltransferase family protein [Candidatus Omnitrophica bacterium]|nr:nucleotidyltransferase family protein [Candidatus Omnitrophota bacterium]